MLETTRTRLEMMAQWWHELKLNRKSKKGGEQKRNERNQILSLIVGISHTVPDVNSADTRVNAGQRSNRKITIMLNVIWGIELVS